jgi:hypothetical protein
MLKAMRTRSWEIQVSIMIATALLTFVIHANYITDNAESQEDDAEEPEDVSAAGVLQNESGA